MFLVLIEYIEDKGRDWSVVAHGPEGRRSVFNSRELAEQVARDKAKKCSNRFAVVEIRSWYQQETREVKVEEVHLTSGNG